MNLLCIEDNVQLIDSLRQFLASGSSITHAATGKEGLHLAGSKKYDAVILDLGLPDISGLEVCQGIRTINSRIPLLILSGSKEPNIKVSLFEAGADDYLTKPFTIAELRARLFALLKRSSYETDQEDFYILKIGNLTLNPLTRQVIRSGKPVRLRRKEFDILEYLMRNRDKIVTRSMIMDNVWDSGSTSWDTTVNVHIKSLRDKIDRPYKRKLIKTAYGLGYTINDKA